MHILACSRHEWLEHDNWHLFRLTGELTTLKATKANYSQYTSLDAARREARGQTPKKMSVALTRRLQHMDLRIQDKTGEINRVQRLRRQAETLRTPRMLAHIATMMMPKPKRARVAKTD